MWCTYTHVYTQIIEKYFFHLRLVESLDLNPRDREVYHTHLRGQSTTANQFRASPRVQGELRVLCTLGFYFVFMVSTSLVY